MYEGKKMLVLGGKPIGSVELVKRAKELGAYVIVTDYLPIEQSPAKRIADECWDISTAEVNKLTDLCSSDLIRHLRCRQKRKGFQPVLRG